MWRHLCHTPWATLVTEAGSEPLEGQSESLCLEEGTEDFFPHCPVLSQSLVTCVWKLPSSPSPAIGQRGQNTASLFRKKIRGHWLGCFSLLLPGDKLRIGQSPGSFLPPHQGQPLPDLCMEVLSGLPRTRSQCRGHLPCFQASLICGLGCTSQLDHLKSIADWRVGTKSVSVFNVFLAITLNYKVVFESRDVFNETIR